MDINKKDRLAAIQDVISGHAVESQEELLSMLKDREIVVTQATLSRDMKLLKIIKSPDADGRYIYTLPGTVFRSAYPERSDIHSLGAAGFVSIEFSGHLGVMKTRPGYAMGIASDIDHQAGHAILGTIAGDDTILLIPREGVSRRTIVDTLASFIPDIHL